MNPLGILLVGAAFLIIFSDDIIYGLSRYRRFHAPRDVAHKQSLGKRFEIWLDRKLHAKYYRVDLPLIRDFIGNLQLAMSLEETLAGALIRTSDQFADKGYFGYRLQRHVRSRLSINPDEVIKALAEDFKSDELSDVVLRLDLARDSGLTAVEALNVSLEQVEAKIQTQLERQIQRSPIILTIPMVVGVFFATVFLFVYPLVLALLQSLTF